MPSEARARPQTRMNCLFTEPRGGRARVLTCRVSVPGVAAPPQSSVPAQLCVRTHEKSLVTHRSQLGVRSSQQKNCFRKQQKGHVNPYSTRKDLWAAGKVACREAGGGGLGRVPSRPPP